MARHRSVRQLVADRARRVVILGLAAAIGALSVLAAGASAAAGPAVSLAWVGIGGDYVSASEATSPDKAADGRFRLTIDPRATRIAVTAIEVRLTDRVGAADGSQIWDTVPGNGLWALGVVQGKRYVNRAGKAVSLPLRARTVLDLYAANSGYFTEGQYFRVTVTLSNGAALRAVAAVQAKPASLTASWEGVTHDQVGRGPAVTADGEKDAHWTLRLGVAGTRTVTDIRVDSADAAGNPNGVAYWNNALDNAWLLAVYQGSTRVNPADGPLSYAVSGNRTLDVYGALAPNTPLARGTTYLVTVTFADGGKVQAVARI